jgi:hypothetical protein
MTKSVVTVLLNIDAVCVNCNKRLRSMRAISMHLKITATRHVVNIIDHGNYDKKTGLITSRNSEVGLPQYHVSNVRLP